MRAQRHELAEYIFLMLAWIVLMFGITMIAMSIWGAFHGDPLTGSEILSHLVPTWHALPTGTP